MDFAQVERENLELRRANRFSEAYDRLHALMDSAASLFEVARLKMLKALTLWRDGPGHLREVMDLTDEVLPELTVSPADLCKLLLVAVGAAHLSHESSRMRLWSGRLKVLASQHAHELKAWLSRVYYALAYAALHFGDQQAAEQYVNLGIQASGASPHGERDAACQRAVGYCMLAEMQVSAGDLTGSVKSVAQVLAHAPVDFVMYPNYVRALVLFHQGAAADVVEDLLVPAENCAIKYQEHYHRLKIAELRARNAARANNKTACREVLRPVLQLAAQARNIPTLTRLQRLMASVA